MGGKGKECCVVYESLIYKIFLFNFFFFYCKIFKCFQNLTTAQDFCRFGAVCTSWHKAAVQANYNPNADHQVPWLLQGPLLRHRQ